MTCQPFEVSSESVHLGGCSETFSAVGSGFKEDLHNSSVAVQTRPSRAGDSFSPRTRAHTMAAQPRDPTFGFPFEPYTIQQDLMSHLYSALAAGQVTVVESPTGTVRLC